MGRLVDAADRAWVRVLAPADAQRHPLRFALSFRGPASWRHPGAAAESVHRHWRALRADRELRRRPGDDDR
jgi:hypothetical protein